jgi:putative transposase
VDLLCTTLQVSPGGYYRWRRRQHEPTPQQMRRQALVQRILEIFDESRQTYGAPRMYEQLRREGFDCSYRTVEELMHKHEISPKRKRKYKSTTDSNHALPVAPNVLGRKFASASPDEVWVTDITYIETGQGWLYLCVFIDLYSRMVVGWSMSDRMTADLAVRAFEMGVSRQGRAPIVCHSDRGSQYASWLFTDLLDDYCTIQSMSRRGNCWDNAPAESFFGSLKSELIHRDCFATRIHASMAVFDYIEIFYNKRRLHSALGFITPWEKVQKGKKVA